MYRTVPHQKSFAFSNSFPRTVRLSKLVWKGTCWITFEGILSNALFSIATTENRLLVQVGLTLVNPEGRHSRLPPVVLHHLQLVFAKMETTFDVDAALYTSRVFNNSLQRFWK